MGTQMSEDWETCEPDVVMPVLTRSGWVTDTYLYEPSSDTFTVCRSTGDTWTVADLPATAEEDAAMVEYEEWVLSHGEDPLDMIDRDRIDGATP